MINLSGYEENVEKSKQIDPVLMSIGKLIFLISGWNENQKDNCKNYMRHIDSFKWEPK